KDTLAWVHEEYRAYCRDRFQDDGSYGESLQYAGYTIFGLMLINETLRRADPERFGSLDLEPYVHTVRWWATALLYVKPLAGWGQHALPRSVNFNDSAAIFRPQADILMHIAARARDSHPTEAGLARWLHDQCYATAEALPHDRGTFGLVPDDNILSLVLLPQAAAAISPATAGCDPLQAHEVGTVFARDAWNGQTILAVSGQDQQQRVQNHNHQDLNHFILCHRGERLLVDPGHCCYRTPVYGLAKQSGSHNTCTIAGHEQVRRGGSRLLCERRSSVQAIAHDVGPAYPDPVREFSRLFLLCGSKALFIVDRIRADEAVDAFWHFVFNNRDGALEIAQLKPGRIVARRGDAGMKLVDGGETRCQGPFYHHIHDAYHPLPAQNGEGQSGSGLMFKHSSGEKRREILRIHGIALDSYGRIPRWHLDPHATGMLIHEKDGARWDLDIHSDPDAWRLRGPDTDLTITTNTAQWSIA
ncbi:MAG: heparinase II/III domain-containing protein, partial [Planctomycetota bacterium]